MKNQKILFPTDFSSQSIKALSETVKLNQHLGYELLVFHAYSRPYTEGYDHKGQLGKAERDIDWDFSAIEKKIPEIKSQQFSFLKRMGDFIDLVEYLIENQSVDLIIMSTKGAVGMGELFGTKTAKLIKSVTVPVIVVPEGCSLSPLGKVGLAVDYSQETPQKKLEFLIKLADLMDFKLDLITLNRDEKTMTKRELNNRENLLKLMEGLSVNLSFTQHPHLTWGLIEYAKTNEIDMIGVIPKSYNFIERAFHESLTKDMAFHSPIPLLVLQ